ncbi:MAG TPA: methionine--tRNA ligase, partial [Symbiobacteriaceae bacterium]|nr:methionine--tRNA ligase [Symbiobacteriaceae bacterium]
MTQEPFYITTSIFYANDRPHIGHALESVTADTIARYQRARGKDVRFLTGTDEYGSKVERKARALGRPLQGYVDEIAAANRRLHAALGAQYDDFVRTTDERHRSAVQRIFTRLYEQGDIYLDRYAGWYCPHEETFYPESRVAPGNLCPECGRPLEWTFETAYKFRLSKYQPQVEALLTQPGFALPDARRNEALQFVRQGLEDIAASRATVKWGIPVPLDPSHTVYVWLDALTNYINALGFASDDETAYRQYWPAALQIVGKDIARFHLVIWPAILLALGAPLPRQVYAHGWINIGGEKISKSKGNAVDPLALVDRFGVDATRYYLLREVPFGLDANYSDEGVVLRINTDLANDLGNLLSRTTQLINKCAGGAVPEPGALSDGVLRAAAAEAVAGLEEALDQYRLADGLASLWRLVGRANKYIEEQAPWALAKDPTQAGRLAAVLYDLAEALRVTAAALVPFLVTTPEQIYEQLGLEPG